MAKVLEKLGLNPEAVLDVGPTVDEGAAISPVTGKVDTRISPEAIELARKFYEAGKKGENWYHDAAKTLGEGFSDEQERVLFALLLAATSVQNEIYTNFIEAGVLFNALVRDARDNFDLLLKWANDESAPGFDQEKVSTSEFMGLNIYKDAIKAKVINLGAKMPNIAKAVQLWLQGSLTKQAVKNLIASSIEQVSPTSFDWKNPFFRKLKIANYALTLVDPTFANTDDNWFNVVVDTWMFRAFYPGADKEDVGWLFGKQEAHANVAEVVSRLAKEAGVSPHMMQAGIWLGIKEKWEGETGGTSDYLAAIDKLVSDNVHVWNDISADAKNLKKIIQKLDVGTAGAVIAKNRGDTLRGRIAKQTQDRKDAKEKAAQDKLDAQVRKVNQVSQAQKLLRAMGKLKEE
jgi:hypothetical protein